MTRPALWNRARPAALAIAREWFVKGMDADDVRQEALLALWVASGTFDPSRGPWMPYARHAVTCRMMDLVNAAARQKRTAALVELDPERDRDPVQLDLLAEQRDRLRDGLEAGPMLLAVERRRRSWRESKRRQRAAVQ